VAAEEQQKKQARVIHARKRWRRRERVKPTRRSIHRRVGARAVSDEGVLGGDLTVVTGSIRWTDNLPVRADVVARGVAGAARGQMATNSRGAWWRVESHNWLRLQRSTDPGLRHHFWWLFWPRGVTVVAQLARAATAGGAQWADDDGPSTDL
jgi:hypothetical protein